MNHNMFDESLNESFTFRPVCYSVNAEALQVSANNAKAIVQFVSDDLFIGISPSGHAITLDTDKERSTAPSPVELLLLALGSCTATDVASILKKKRQRVTRYAVEISGDRRDDYPRKYTSMKVHHILTGHGLSPKAVAQAIELSDTKYCSVAATLRPGVEIQSSFEIIEAPADPTGEN